MGLFSKPETITPELLKAKGFKKGKWGNPHRWDQTKVFYSKVFKWNINGYEEYVEMIYFPAEFNGYVNIRTFDSQPFDDYIRHPKQMVALCPVNTSFNRLMELKIETFEDMELAKEVYKQALMKQV